MSTINIEKTKEIMYYFSNNIDNLYFTKLLKLFYYVDFISLKENSAAVTNDIYYKLPYGPVPTFIKNEVDNLVVSSEMDVPEVTSIFKGVIKVERQELSSGHSGYIIKPLDKAAEGYLSKPELEIVKKVCKRFSKTTVKEITEKTHRETPYRFSNDNGIIDYSLASRLDLAKIFNN